MSIDKKRHKKKLKRKKKLKQRAELIESLPPKPKPNQTAYYIQKEMYLSALERHAKKYMRERNIPINEISLKQVMNMLGKRNK